MKVTDCLSFLTGDTGTNHVTVIAGSRMFLSEKISDKMTQNVEGISSRH